MNKLSRENYEKIKHLDREFWRVKYSQYKRATRREDNELVTHILEETTGVKQNVNFSCNTCIFNLFYDMTKYYFPAKEEYEANTGDLETGVVQVSTEEEKVAVCSNGTANNEEKQTEDKCQRRKKTQKSQKKGK